MSDKNHITISNTEFYRFVMPAISSNMYVTIAGEEAFVVDPCISEEALGLLRANKVTKATVFLTHEHYDHISGVNWLRENASDVEVICSEECSQRIKNPEKNFAKFWDVMMMDKPDELKAIGLKVADRSYSCSADKSFGDSFTMNWKGHTIVAKKAPGHSPGGALLFFDELVLFSGDNLVEGHDVICKFPGGSKQEYETITRPMLENVDDSTFIMPGHGGWGSFADIKQYLTVMKRGKEKR